MSLINPKAINSLVDGLTTVVKLVDNFVESLGGGIGVLRNFGGIAFNMFSN
jgi:hypothetical protein